MITVKGELYSSKNSKQILKRGNQRFIAKSFKAMGHESDLLKILPTVRMEWAKEVEGKEYPLRISFKIYRKTKRRFDYVNIVQNLLDCMVKAGLVEDDNADIVIPVFEPYSVDKENPRTEIRVL